MFEASVQCPNDECSEYFEYKCEHEDSGDGSEHETICPGCGALIEFEIAYFPSITNERVKPVE